MSDTQPPNDPGRDIPPEDPISRHEQADARKRHFSAVWLIPIIAALIAGWLGYRAFYERGPLITITFNNGEGITASQTQVKYKAVQLGTVESVRLSKDMTHVVVRVRMRSEAEDRLTDQAKFWVVRPRITAGNISGLETLVSGAYIAMDPGEAGGKARRNFAGLENPPSRRSDEPGTTYVLQASVIGGLGQGSPVFYRDIPVGEVLGYDQPGLNGKIKVHVFIRAPYDKYVRDDSRFWNTSGVQVQMGSTGIHVHIESLQAVLSGGVAFSTPPESRDEAAKPETSFRLFRDYDAAVAATSRNRIGLLSYFTGPVRGLEAGSEVTIDGIRVGSVTSTALEYDAATQTFRVPVHMAIEPDLLTFVHSDKPDLRAVINDYIQRGMQAQLQTSSFLTGSMLVSLSIPPKAKPGTVQMEGNDILIPGSAGGMDNIVNSLSDIAAKLNDVPFDKIGNNLNDTLANLNQIVASPEVKNAVRDLSATLANIRHLVNKTDAGLSPVLQQLPELEAHLNSTLQHASDVLGAGGYGGDSRFHRDVTRLMDEADNTLRSIRELANFLNRHPEALIRGRTGEAPSR